MDVFFDDPTDDDPKTNYASEVFEMSNLADILVFAPDQNIISNLEIMDGFQMKAYLHLNEIFFELKETGGDKSGVINGLRSDYQERWTEFVNVNHIEENQKYIQAFYMGEEPFWNGISFEELKEACDYVKADFPNVKIMMVEAPGAIDEMMVPESVDWVGFDHYFIKDPTSNQEFQEEFELLKTKCTNGQQIIVVMDSHFLPLYHRLGGIKKSTLDEVARNYYALADSDEMVVGIIGYFWPSGFDLENSTGARGLPQHVKNEYIRIGKAITGK
ncbi:hypothetical protein GCM10007940_30300 [Portibacter lacus]|uniref:Uncharacterized protein n=1 Tax=Portibacter lacus TaxID=1099794 RepID=A0AA37SRU3_9BACT|nr:hypothetical protein GCM10007940_30300 [Portibacter lacus]